MDVSHVYVRTLVLGCFHGLISTQTFRRAPTTSVDSCASGQLCGDKECPFSDVTKSGLELGGSARKQCSECAVRFVSEVIKAALGVK